MVAALVQTDNFEYGASKGVEMGLVNRIFCVAALTFLTFIGKNLIYAVH